MAGSGKTTTAINSLKYFPATKIPVYLAFNAHIARELQKRLPEGKEARTYHSLGLAIIKRQFGNNVEVNQDKLDLLIGRSVSKKENKYIYFPVRRIVSLLKGNLLEPTEENILDLCAYHEIDLGWDKNLAVDLAIDSFQGSKEMTSIVDFDDMCWLPVALDLPAPRYDLVIIDELQDTNKVQIELAIKIIKKSGRAMGIGDRFQSIYGWRGADVDAIPSLIQRLDALSLPLSITYRNPLSVVELVKSRFPYIPLEAREDAIEGQVSKIDRNSAIDLMQSGDMVLCRTNAPLIPLYFHLIRNGTKAQVKGRDIGKTLHTLIRKVNPRGNNDLYTFFSRLNEYTQKEVEKLMWAEKESLAILMQDKCDTIIALSDGCDTVDCISDRLDEVFSDEIEGITLSSIHKAKGLESKNVFILRPDQLPHPMAKQDWQKQQELNIEYVAYTRAMENLFIVS